MTTLTKVLIGAAAVTAVAVVTTVVKKNEQKNNDIAEQAVEQDHKNDGILKRIKRYVTKKVIRILGWVAIHMEQIEAASAIIGFVGTIISITGAVRDFVRNNDLSGKLDEINKKLDDMDTISLISNNIYKTMLRNINRCSTRIRWKTSI